MFGFPITTASRPVLFFIGLLGLIYGSLFWAQVFPINIFIGYLKQDFIVGRYWIPYLISYSLLLLFQLALFLISLYTLIKCIRTKEVSSDSELNNEVNIRPISLFGFRLTKSSIGVLFILSIIAIIYWIPILITNISQIQSIRFLAESNRDLEIDDLLEVAYCLIQIETSLTSIVFSLIVGMKCLIAKKKVLR